MRIHTALLLDWDGNLLAERGYDYSGPLALCDRSMQAAAGRARNMAEQTAGQYGAEASGIYGGIVPTMMRYATGGAPGYGPVDTANMMTQASLAAGGKTSALEEQARLRGARTGNIAGVGAAEAGMAEGSSRAMSEAIREILASSARAKLGQQSEAMRGLQGMYGTAARSQLGAEELIPRDIEAEIAAGQTGWLQNLEQAIVSGSQAFKNIASGIGSLRGGGSSG